MENFLALFYHDFFVLVHSNYGRIQFYINASPGCFCQKLFPDDKASDLRLMLLGAEEFMDLLKKLSTRLFILLIFLHLFNHHQY